MDLSRLVLRSRTSSIEGEAGRFDALSSASGIAIGTLPLPLDAHEEDGLDLGQLAVFVCLGCFSFLLSFATVCLS